MPGIITGPGLQSIGDNTELADFANAISGATGLDPRVVYAWGMQETGGHPYGGYHNWLNLRPYPGDPYIGVSSGNFEEYASVQQAEAATIRRLRQPFASGIVASKGTTPADEISAIAASGWDAGHYGGTGGPNLLRTFQSIYPNVNAGGAALKPGSTVSGSLGGGQTPGSLASGVTGVADGIVGFLKEWIVRGAFIIIGTGLALVGLYLIARSFGAPSVGIADKVTTVATRGAVKPSPARRQAGDAAIARGEPVTRASEPRLHTARETRRYDSQQAKAQARRMRAQKADLDAKYGADAPF